MADYALMPGYKLPPLMFSNDETVALSIGLRVARELGLSDMTPAVASTQAKLDRVMPTKLKRKISDLNAVVSLDLAAAAGRKRQRILRPDHAMRQRGAADFNPLSSARWRGERTRR